MKYENGNFIIYYNEDDKNINVIIELLENKTKDIFDYFEVKKLSEKIIIKIYYSIDDFKKYLVPYLELDGDEYKDWMCASTHDGNINLLDIESCRNTEEHQDMDIDYFLTVVLHELVHKCNMVVKGGPLDENHWFYEALATNLSKDYFDLKYITEELSILNKDFNNIDFNYNKAFTIGQYLLHKYSRKEILEFCKDETLLNDISIDDVNEYVKEKTETIDENIKYPHNSSFEEIDKIKEISKLIKYNNHYFHGSPKLLEVLSTNQSHDSSNNEVNIDNALFLTDSFFIASAYAFKDSLKDNKLKYNFNIKSRLELPIMTMENVVENDDIEGYIYVFEKTNEIINEPVGSVQYKSYKELKPIDIIKIKYKDFKFLYEVNDTNLETSKERSRIK